jgi:phenylacetate-CoA ligase
MRRAPYHRDGRGYRESLMFEFLKRAPFVEDLIRRNPIFYAQFRQLLDEAESLSESDRMAMRRRLLARSVSHAIRLPGYRDAAGAIAIDALPILTKEMLQAHTPDFHSHQWPGIRASTGGSTGRPLRLLRSARSIVVEQATIDWLAAKAGVALDRCRVAVLRGDNIKDPNDQTPPFWRRDGSRRLVLSSNHLGPAHYKDFTAALEEFQPDVLHAYPSSLQLLTGLAEEYGTKLRLPLVLTSSETLRPGLRARVRDVFGAALLDHYGMAERVSAAYSLEDGVYRFIFPYAATELIAEGENTSRVIGSSLWNTVQPLLRYDTGDIALMPPGSDSRRRERIALGLEPFPRIEGRASDVLELASGSRVYALDQVARGIDGASSVQFLQQESDLVQIIVVPSHHYGADTIDAITRNFYLKAPKSVRIQFDLRDAPYRLPNGKAPVFVSGMARV